MAFVFVGSKIRLKFEPAKLKAFISSNYTNMVVRKVLSEILLTALLAALLQWWLPWWIVAVAAFVAAFIYNSRSSWQAFVIGFLGIGLLWLVYCFIIDLSSLYILSSKVSAIFGVPTILLGIVTALIGGITGGLGAMCGNLFRKIFNPRERKTTYYSGRRR